MLPQVALSSAQAAQHLLNRRRARVDPVTYAGVIEVPGRPLRSGRTISKAEDDELEDFGDIELFSPVETHLATHHGLILEAMDRISRKKHGRGLFLMPPGSAKTTYASVVFPSHYMGRVPGCRLGLGTYGDGLAKKMGRKTRSIIKQQKYRAVWPGVELSRESSAANQFILTNGSEYMAASLAGDFPGNRLDGAICDDPIKGRLEAKSPIETENTWELFQDNFISRLVPGGWAVLILTHWDEKDPAGHILPDGWKGESGIFEGKHDGFDWEVMCIQAKCETTTDPLGRHIGQYFWPEWFDRQHWQQYERNPVSWNSLCQQRPRALEGAFFAEEDLLVNGHPVEVPQLVDFVYAIIDSAVKTGKQHDGLAVTFFARSKLMTTNPPLTILDWDVTQVKGAFLNEWLPSVFTQLETFATACKARLGVAGVWIEDKASGTILLQQAARKPEWKCYPIASGLTAMGKKERALDVSGHVRAGKVKLTYQAYTRTRTFKERTRNHLLSQVLNFSPESKDTEADDLLDTFTYGIAMVLGNVKGF